MRELVRRGYDTISALYRSDVGTANPETSESTADYAQWMHDLAAGLPGSARVLDLGCGAGIPAAKQLVEAGLQVVGVDISAVQLRRARRLVPTAAFVQADMAPGPAGRPPSTPWCACTR